MDIMRYLVEFIGTFIFLSVILITGQAIPIGLILAGMVYWGGAISGGAFNPAVSLALLIKKSINVHQFIGYIIVQFLAAIGAYHFFRYTKAFTKISS
tara:strand:+ start:1657 stop:1947 length:291 start_codon:yes stop_codon:yes gene_type:complete